MQFDEAPDYNGIEDDATAQQDEGNDGRYRWQGQVWKPGLNVAVYRDQEPPQFVTAFRQHKEWLTRQAPAADGSSLWTWSVLDDKDPAYSYSVDGYENVPWATALDLVNLTTFRVARVSNEPREAAVHVGPIMPGKWYREHTADQLRQEHDRRGLSCSPLGDVDALADSLVADDARREQLASLGMTAEQAAAGAGEAAAALRRAANTPSSYQDAVAATFERLHRRQQAYANRVAGARDKLGRDGFSPFPTPARRPAEPDQGTVLGFTKHYHEDGPGYSFAAVRATGRHAGWFLSGPKHTAQPLTWDQLLDFVGGPVEWARIGVVAEWISLGDL